MQFSTYSLPLHYKILAKYLHCSEMKYVRIIYNMLYNDCINFPNKVTWVTLHRNLLGNLVLWMFGCNKALAIEFYFLILVK